jgi:SAM-dependent methyltransferase
MGYVESYFSSRVRGWQSLGWLPPGGRFIDFGAQELAGDPRTICADLAALGLDVDKVPRVAEVFRALGIDYVAIDVDTSNGAVFFDLNTQAPPSNWLGAFDFVNNAGTIEHLVYPLNALHVAHDIVKVGGVVCHSVPMLGHRKHGLFNLTPKFWSELMLANRYEPLETFIDFQDDDRAFGYTGFTLRDSAGNHLARTTVPNAWGNVTYRKTRSAPFIIPTDHLLFPLGGLVAADLQRNYERLAQARPVAPVVPLRPSGTVAASAGSIGQFLLWRLYVRVWLALKPLLPRW